MTSRRLKAEAGEVQWLDIQALTRYASVSERTLRDWIHRADNPLPAMQVGNKILVHRNRFDEWLEKHQLRPAQAIDVKRVIDDIVGSVMETA